MAVVAINPERLAHHDHERIGPFGLFDRGHVCRGQRRRTLHPDVVGLFEKRRERIVRQARIADLPGRMRHPRLRLGDAFGRRPGVVIPDVLRHRVAAMAGVAGDARLLHMGRPVAVDVLRHLQHAARHDLRVFLVECHVFEIVAVGAALLGRHPCRHAHHQPRELANAEFVQHANILVGVARLVPVGVGGRKDVGDLGLRGQGGSHAGIVYLHQARTAKAALHGDDGRVLHAAELPHSEHRAGSAGNEQQAEKNARFDWVVHVLLPERARLPIGPPLAEWAECQPRLSHKLSDFIDVAVKERSRAQDAGQPPAA